MCFAYNSSVHAVTKLTPFELMFGRKSNIPLDLVYGQLHDTEEILRQYEVEWDYTEYSLKLKEDLASMYEYAVVNRDSSVQKSALIHDRDLRGCDLTNQEKEFGCSTKRPEN